MSIILKNKELTWYQISRAKWLVDGGRHTKYYHIKAINIHRMNMIIMLKNDEG